MHHSQTEKLCDISLGYFFVVLTTLLWEDHFTFLGICPKNIICVKAFLLLSHFHLLFPQLLLPLPPLTYICPPLTINPRRNCIKIEINQKNSQK